MGRRGAFSAGFVPKPDEAPADSAAGSQPEAQPMPPGKSLSLEEAKTLLERLRTACTRLDFQKALVNLRNRGWGAFKKRQAVARLLAMAWTAHVKASGFPINAYGFIQMLDAIKAVADQPGIRTLSEEVERNLKFSPGALFGAQSGSMKGIRQAVQAKAAAPQGAGQDSPSVRDKAVNPGKANAEQSRDNDIIDSAAAGQLNQAAPALQPGASAAAPPGTPHAMPAGDTVEFVARHVVEDVIVKLQMPKGATFLQVKQAIAKNVGRDEILKKGRLVKKKGGIYSSYKDHDLIGDIREVLVLGADLKVVDSDSDGEPPSVQPAVAARPKAPEVDAGAPSRKAASPATPQTAAKAPLPPSPPSSLSPPSPAAAAAKAAAPPPPPESRPVEVCIRHAVDGREVRLQMMTNSTFMEIKEALAKKLGREDVRKRARLVFKSAAGAWASYKDGEVLGDKTELHLLGADLSVTEARAVPPGEAAKAGPAAKPAVGVAASKAGPQSAASAPPSAAVPKPLAKPAVKRELLTLPRAQDLLRRLLRICQDPGFQRDLDAALSGLSGNQNEAALKSAVGKVFGRSCKNTLGGFGFAEDRAGLEQLSNELWLLAEDPTVVELTARVEKALRVSGGSWFGIDNDDAQTAAPQSTRPEPAPAASSAASVSPSEAPVQAPSDSDTILSRQRVLQLMDAFAKAFSTDKCQKALDTLTKRGGIALQLGLAQLMGTAAGEAANELGLKDWKLQRLVESVKEHGSDLTVRARSRDLEKLMRTEVGKVFGMADPEPAAPQPQIQTMLSSDQVTKLLANFLAAIGEPKFTKALDTMYKRGGITLQLGLSQLMGQASKAATSALGLEDWALQKTIEAVKEHAANTSIRKSAREVEKALRAEPGKYFGMKEEDDAMGTLSAPAPKASAAKPPQMVDVSVQLGAEGATEVKVRVPETATLEEVKEKVARQLDRPEVMTKGRLAQKAASGGFVALRGSDKLGIRRQVLLLGVDLEGDEDSDSEEENADAVDAAVPVVNALGRQSLIAKAAQSAAPASKADSKEFTLEQALALQRELLEGFSAPEFQKKLRQLERSKKDMAGSKWALERQNLILEVQAKCLPSYGFKGDYEGVAKMMSKMSAFNDDAEFNIKGIEINAVLGLPVPAGYEKLRPAEEVEVRIRHADLGDEIYVKVPDTCLMKDVLEAIYEEIKRPEVKEKGRIVKKMGGVFASYLSTEPLGNRRRLSYLGTDLTMKPPMAKKDITKLLRMQKELYAAFKSDKFQNELKGYEKKFGFDSSEFRLHRFETISVRQREVLPKYGFADTPTGINTMLAAFAEAMQPGINEGKEIDEMRKLGAEIDGLLWQNGPPSEAPQASPSSSVPDAAKVSVSVQLGVDGMETDVLVLPGASIRDVKQAVATKLEKPAITGSGRVVKSMPNGGFSTISETEKIGSRRNFLVLGFDAEVEAREDAEESMGNGRKAVGDAVQAVELPRTVEVTVVPMIEGDKGEVRVRVPSNATIGDVRQAVSDKINQTFTSSQGRITVRRGGGYVSVNNDEKLGARRRLAMTGVDASAFKEAKQVPQLSTEDAIRLTEELVDKFSESSFQKALQDLAKIHSTSSVAFNKQMRTMVRAAQISVIPKYGFSADDRGVIDMMVTLNAVTDPVFIELSAKAEALLKMESTAADAEARPPTQPQEAQYQGPPQSVEVRLKHAESGEELYVTVLETATMRDLLVAASQKIGDTNILSKGRLVKKAGSLMTAYSADEQIGVKRRLLYLGTKLPPSASEESHPGVELTVTQVIALQTEMIELLEGDEFQRKLDALEKDHLKGSMQYRTSFREILDDLYDRILPKHGLKNEAEMFKVIGELRNNQVVDHNVQIYTSLLRADDGDISRESVSGMVQKIEENTAPAKSAAVSKVPKVEVKVSHVVDGTSVRIMVPTTATLLKVKTVMAEKFGDEQIVKKGKIVSPQGETFVTLENQERLGNRRKLSYIGTKLPEQKQIRQIQDALSQEDEENEKPAADSEVTVTVKHAVVPNREVQVTVRSSAKVQDVREAVLAQLEESGAEVAKKLRFVERASGALRTMDDSEKLGAARSVLVMGIDLPKPSKQVKNEPKNEEVSRADGSPRLKLAEVVSLLRRIQRICRNPSFQKQMEDVQSNSTSGEMARRGVIGTIFWSSIVSDVATWGFSRTRTGSDQMFSEIFNYSADAQVIELTQNIESLLKVPAGTWFGISPWLSNDVEAELTLEQAKEALGVSKNVVTSQGFSKALEAIREKHGNDPERMGSEVAQMLTESLRTTTVAFGFGGTADSAWKMFETARKHENNSTVAALLKDIFSILKLQAATTSDNAAAETPDMPQQMGVVEVQVKHAVDKNAVTVTVDADTATMRDVKKAVSERLGKAEVLSSGRIVRIEGGAFTSYRDEERLGKRRRLLYLGTDLLPRLGPSGRPLPQLSVETALDLQKEFIDTYRSTAFQGAVEEMRKNTSKTDWFAATWRIAFVEIKRILPKYGFEGNDSGFADMSEAFSTFVNDDIDANGYEIRRLLGGEEVFDSQKFGAFRDRSSVLAEERSLGGAGALKAAQQKDDKEVVVTIKHALDNKEVELKVSRQIMMWEVKKALADKLNRPEVSRRGRIVKEDPATGSYMACKDQERLGNRRQLLLLGVELATDAELAKAAEGDSELKAEKVQDEPQTVTKHSIPELTLVEALELQRDLIDGFRDEEFQSSLRQLFQNYATHSPQFQKERQKLFLTVQSVVLPRYGFLGNSRGVMDMMQVCTPFNAHQEFEQNGRELNRLLGLEVSGETVAPPAPLPPEEIQVTIQHLDEDENLQEAMVAVLSTASMKDVKEAVAKKFGNPLIVSKGRLAQKVRNGFVSFKDPDPVGKRRVVMLMGVKLEQVEEILDSDEDEGEEQPQIFGWASAALPEAQAKGRTDGASEELAAKLNKMNVKIQQAEQKQEQQQLEEAGQPAEPEKPQPGEAKQAPVEAAPVKVESTVEKPRYSRERLLELQKSLIEGFRNEDWQRKLRRLEKSYAASKDRQFPNKRQELFWEVQRKVLPKFGFSESPNAVSDMMKAFATYAETYGQDEQILVNGYEINALLGLQVPAGYETLRPSEDVQVRLRHAETMDEIYVTVPDICTMKDVLDAAAKQLGREDVASSGRIVKKAGDFFVSYGISEPLGNRRRLLILGADLTAVDEDPTIPAALEERQRIPVNWSIDVALKLQQELYAAFSSAAFQRKIGDVEEKFKRSPKEFSIKRLDLVLSEQYKIIPSYGFSKDAAGARDMVMAMSFAPQAFSDDESSTKKLAEINRLGTEIDKILRTGAFSPTAEAKAAEAEGKPSHPAPPSLDIEQARSLQLTLRDEFAAKAFQDELKALEIQFADDTSQLRTRRQNLIGKVQMEVIPKYGFQPTILGIRDMLRVLGSYQEDLFIETGNEINVLIGLVPGGSTAASAPRKPEEVDVRLKQVDSEDELHVTVLDTALVRDVLAAAAHKLGRDEILTSGRLVRRVAGGFLQAYKPEEAIGLKRRMLLVGAELTPKMLVGEADDKTPDKTLTVAQAKELQRDLYAEFSAKKFQAQLKELVRKFSTSSKEFLVGRLKMIREVQSRILPMYGFSVDAIDDMLKVYSNLIADPDIARSHPDIARTALELNEVLLIDDPTLLKRVAEIDSLHATTKIAQAEALKGNDAKPSNQEADPSEKVEKVFVTVTHGIDDTQVKVSVLSNATLRDVKIAVGKYLEKPGLVRSGSFVRRMGGEGYISMKDDELLGDRRKLTILGTFGGLKHAREAADKTWEAEEKEEEEAAHQLQGAEITVKVSHAADGGEVQVHVASTAKVFDVKEALVELLGQPELIDQIRLVKRVGAAGFVTMKDSEKLNDMRQVFMLGADLPGSVGQADDEEDEDLEGEPTEPNKLTPKQAKALLKRMRRVLQKPDVQKSVKEARRLSVSKGEMSRRAALGMIFLSWVKGEIASFGFTEGQTGLDSMFQEMFNNSQDPDVYKLIQDVEELLDVKPGTWFGVSPGNDEAPTLTLEQAKDAARSAVLTLKSKAFRDAARNTTAEFLPGLQRYFLRGITVGFGFGGQDESLSKLREAMQVHMGNSEIRSLSKELDQLLASASGTAESTTAENDTVADASAAAETQEQPASVDVSVKHAIDKNSIYVSVVWTASMRDVKTALAQKLGRQEILNNGRIVTLQTSSTFSAYKDSEKLGKRRRLLFLGADLVPRLGPSGKPLPLLNVERGLALQDDLMEGFGYAEFQSRLKSLEENRQLSSLDFAKARRELLFEVQSKVLPKYGFVASYEGIFDMTEAFFDLMGNEEIQRKTDEIEKLIRLSQPTTAPPSRSGQQSTSPPVVADTRTGVASAEAEDPTALQDVKVVIRHALDLHEVELTVKSRWTMWEIREALAAQLSRPDVAQKARFVRALEDGFGFTSFKDSERLGNRRRLLLLGVDLKKDDEGEGDADSDVEEEASRLEATRKITQLTLQQAIALQKELQEGFEDANFQADLKALQAKSLSQAAFFRDRQRLLLSVQSKILPKYGFSSDSQGVFDMISVMNFNDPEFEQRANAIERLLGLDGQGPPSSAASAPEKNVEVRVKHAVDGDVVSVMVPISAKMSDVIEAVAKEINSSSVMQGRIVRKTGSGNFAAYASSHALAKRRRLLFLGAELKAVEGSKRVSKVLTKEAALALQRDLMAGFRDKSFQVKLEELAARHRRGSPMFLTNRVHLALEVQNAVLPKHGFRSGIDGVNDMMWSFRSYDNDLEVQYLGGIIGSLLWPGLASLDGEWLNGDQVVVLKENKVRLTADEVYDFEEKEDLRCVVKFGSSEFQGQLEPDLCKVVWSNGEVWTREMPQAEPAPESPGPTSVPLARALLLLKDISQALATPQAQSMVKLDLSGESKRRPGWIFSEVCNPVISKFGFESSHAGYDRMFEAILEHRQDPQIAAEAQAAEVLLGVDTGSWFGIEIESSSLGGAVQKDEASKPQLTLGRARELLGKFRKLFLQPGIVKELDASPSGEGDESQRRLALGRIFATTCRPVVTEFGFSSTREGFEHMFDALIEHRDDPTLMRLAWDIETSLRVPRGSWFGFSMNVVSSEVAATTEAASSLREFNIKSLPSDAQLEAPAEASEPEEVTFWQIRVKHASSENHIFVLVPEGADFLKLREAIAEKVNDPDVLKHGRLVKKKGNYYNSYRDNELIGKRRRLLYLGTDLPHDPARMLTEQEDADEAGEDATVLSGLKDGNGENNLFFAKPKDAATQHQEALAGLEDELDDIFAGQLEPVIEQVAPEVQETPAEEEEASAEPDHELLASLGLGGTKLDAEQKSADVDHELLASLGLTGAEPASAETLARVDQDGSQIGGLAAWGLKQKAYELEPSSASAPEPASDASTSAEPGGLLGTWDAEFFTIELVENSATFSTGEVFDFALKSPTTCCLRLYGQDHYGHLHADGKRLLWDDGDIWTRE